MLTLDTQDLHISPSEYNVALALYFVAYVSFEVPANVNFIVYHSLNWTK